MRKFWISMISLIFAISLTGCGGSAKPSSTPAPSQDGKSSTPAKSTNPSEPKSGGMLKAAINSDPTTLNPYVYSTTTDRQVFKQIFNNLYEINLDTLQPEPKLVKADISEDGLTYTLNLQKNVKFHNGKPMLAADIKHSFEKAMAPEASRTSSILASINEIDIKDDSTVIVKLKQRDNEMLWTFTDVYVTPNDDSIDQSKNPVGTGPFKFVEWKRNQEIVLEKNKDYWEKGLPYLDGITFKTIPDANVKVLQLQNGQVDFIDDVPTSRIEELKNNPNLKISVSDKDKLTVSHFMLMNDSKAPFNNVKFRQAVNYALDRDKMEKSLFGTFVPRSSAILPGSPAYNPNVIEYKKDLDKAKQLLKESGYNGQEVELLYHNISLAYDTVAKITEQSLKDAGINVKLKGVEIAQWVDQVFNKKQFDIALTGTIPKPSPVDLLNHNFGKINKASIQWDNKEWYDNLLKAATLPPDQEKKLLDDLQVQVAEQSPGIIIGGMASAQGLGKKVQGYKNHPQNLLIFEKTWLDK